MCPKGGYHAQLAQIYFSSDRNAACPLHWGRHELFFPSSELVYSEIEYCTFILAAVMTVCTAMVISQLKKRDKNDPGDKDADDK